MAKYLIFILFISCSLNQEVYKVRYTREYRRINDSYIYLECDNTVIFSNDTIWFNDYYMEVKYFHTEGNKTRYRVNKDEVILNHLNGEMTISKEKDRQPFVYYKR